MNKKVTIAVVLGVIILLALIYVAFLFRPVKYVPHVPVELDPETLPGYLSSLQLIDDLPRHSKIQINFGEYEYYVLDGEVVEGQEENPEMILSVPEEYIDRIGEVGACQASSEALDKNELSLEKLISDTELLWKYQSMLRYKDCLGL